MGKTRGYDWWIKMKINKPATILRTAFALIVGLLLFSACKRNSNYQGEGELALQGTWLQESVSYQNELLNYSLHEFRFTCDSVYVKINHFAEKPILVDSCYNSGEWTEYAQGMYVMRNDSLLIEATYMHPNGKQKLTGCYTIGQYIPRFKVSQLTTDSLFLQPRNSHIPINMRKTEITKCVPQKIY